MKSYIKSISAYLHIPFCRKLCSYCDFTTYEKIDALIPDYSHALSREIELVVQSSNKAAKLPLHSIYFGGGTPSLLPIHMIRLILSSLQQSFDILPNAEITIEANPGTVDLPYLNDLHTLGVNRISIGAQSAQSEELRMMERSHSFQDVVKMVRDARTAGFNNLNLDLIFGLPRQRMRHWRNTVTRALQLQPEHLSLYGLTLEHGTPLRTQVQRGILPVPDSDLAADMYEWASDTLTLQGFTQYEISNWSHNSGNFTCRHNLQYWQNLPYLAFGAGSHGWFNGYRYANTRSPQVYIECMKMMGSVASNFPFSPAVRETNKIDQQDEMNETLMMGLRLLPNGVYRSSFQARFGVPIEQEYFEPLRRLQAQGLVDQNSNRVRLSKTGLLLANRVFAEFL